MRVDNHPKAGGVIRGSHSNGAISRKPPSRTARQCIADCGSRCCSKGANQRHMGRREQFTLVAYSTGYEELRCSFLSTHFVANFVSRCRWPLSGPRPLLPCAGRLRSHHVVSSRVTGKKKSFLWACNFITGNQLMAVSTSPGLAFFTMNSSCSQLGGFMAEFTPATPCMRDNYLQQIHLVKNNTVVASA